LWPRSQVTVTCTYRQNFMLLYILDPRTNTW
jgi:hypothetical protein